MKERIWVRFSRLGKTARIKRGIVLGAEACISVICLVMAVVYGVNGDPYNRLFSCLMAGLLLWVPIIVERLAKHRFSFTQHAAFIILLAGGAVAGSVFYPTWLEDGMELCTDTLNHLLTDLPVYRLDNRADRESVEILAKELDRIT